MDFKQYLVSLGLTEEQATKIVSGMPTNKFYLTAEENMDVRYAKIKDDLAQAKTDLTTANKLVDDLKKGNTNIEALQTKIKDYETQVATLETERAKDRKTFAIKEALTKAGANDIEYMMFKFGDVELDKDGSIKDLDNKVKTLKEGNPSFFKAADPVDPNNDPTKKGYKPIDNKLPGGNPPGGDAEPKNLAEAIKQQYTKKEVI